MFHSMTCYLLTQEGKYTSESENTYVFPCFANLRKGGAADKVSTAIEACVGKVEEVTTDMTSSGLRVASSDEMVSYPLLNVVGAIARGGWYFEGESQLFYYLTKRFHVTQGGLVLGQHDPTKHCPMYRIDSIMNDKDRENILCYITQLFLSSTGKASIKNGKYSYQRFETCILSSF